MKEGRGLKPSARAAGIGKETGYRWFREAFLALRDEGLSVVQAAAELGYCSPLLVEWERQRVGRRGRHHLSVAAEVENVFWGRFEAGDSIGVASRAAGVGRSTGYRWWRARYGQLREQGVSPRAAAARLRIPPALAAQWEDQRRRAGERVRRQREALQRRALRTSARFAEELSRRRAPRSDMLARDTR